MNLNELKDFCEEYIQSYEEDLKNFKFIIAKYSEEQPYYCVFAAVMKNRKKCIYGYCFANELSLESVLDLVYSFDCKVEVSNKFMF